MLQVSGDKIYRFVTLTPATHVVGVIASAGQLVASYRDGNRIWVRALGTETDPTSDVAATTVIPAPQPATLRSVGKTPIVYHPERPYWTMTWGNAVLIVMPWTTIEPSGDITTYDAFLALAAPSGSTVDLEGEGWIVGNNVTHMRGVKLTRRTQQQGHAYTPTGRTPEGVGPF